MKPINLLLLTTMIISISGLIGVAYAQEESGGGSADGSKLIGAGIAFGVAAGGAGVGLGYVGSAGLAVISENPALQSKVFIFIGMVEFGAITASLLVSSSSRYLFSTLIMSFFFDLPLGTLSAIVMTLPSLPSISKASRTLRPLP